MEYRFSDKVKNLEANAIREIFKVISKPGIISFAGGLPASDALPRDEIREIINSLLSSSEGIKLLQYGATEGYLPFLEEGIKYVKRVGIENVSLDQIMAISGGQQGIDLTCKAFLNKNDVVLVEDPTYLAVLHILKTYEAKAVGLKSGKDGLDIKDFEKKVKKYKPKLVYLVPTFSNPTGITLSEEKRREIARIINENNVVLIEDNPYGELRFKKEHINAIKSFDIGGNVIYLTSFSKTISPGMRIGLLVANEKIVRKLAIGKQATDVHTALINQAAAARFLSENRLDPMLKKHIPLYRNKCNTMLRAISKYFPKGIKYTKPEGGLFIWVKLKKHMDADELFKRAVDKGVAFVPGSPFFANSSGKNTFRLNFSNASLEQIDVGIKIIGGLIEEML